MIEWAKSQKPGSAEGRAAYDEARIASRPGRKKKEVAVDAVKEGGLVDEATDPEADADLNELTE